MSSVTTVRRPVYVFPALTVCKCSVSVDGTVFHSHSS